MVTIYELICTVTDKRYIGSTKNLAKRMREHRCLLRAERHACKELQADWTRCGEEHFVARSIEQHEHLSVAAKRQRELHWMRHYQALGTLYNERLIAYQGPPGSIQKAGEAWVRIRRESGWKQSAESNQKRRLAQLGKPKGHGAKISATKRRKRLDSLS